MLPVVLFQNMLHVKTFKAESRKKSVITAGNRIDATRYKQPTKVLRKCLSALNCARMSTGSDL